MVFFPCLSVLGPVRVFLPQGVQESIKTPPLVVLDLIINNGPFLCFAAPSFPVFFGLLDEADHEIAAAVDAGILGYDMYLENQQFYGGDGIVTKGVDKTVTNVGRLAREGMKQTDKTILEIMLSDGKC